MGLILVINISLFSVASAGTDRQTPLVKTLPSGTTLMISPDRHADYVGLYLLIDKRSFKSNNYRLYLINHYLRGLGIELEKFGGITQIYPMTYLPESPYNFKEQGYLIYKIKSDDFEKNQYQILNRFIGKPKPGRYLFYDQNRLIERSVNIGSSFPADSVRHLNILFKKKNFSQFINNVTLKKNIYLYISGNVNVFQIVNNALKIGGNTAVTEENPARKDTLPDRGNRYWTFVLQRYLVGQMKLKIGGKLGNELARLYAPLENNGESIRLWIQTKNHNNAISLNDVQQIFSDKGSFELWYRKNYLAYLEWIYKDPDQRALLSLLSQMYFGRNLVFKITLKPEIERIEKLFGNFREHILIGEPGR